MDDGDKKCQLCLIGCPAVSEPYVQFNEDVSISKNSIFVKNVISEDHEYAQNTPVDSSNACEEPFRPSMVYDEKTKTYDTGYEVRATDFHPCVCNLFAGMFKIYLLIFISQLYYEEGKANMKCEKYDDFIEVIV